MSSFKYNFVIITPGRSGSEHLSETLNSCEDITMEGEVFNRTNNGEHSFNTSVKSNYWRKLISYFFNREKLSKISINLPLRHLILSFFSTTKLSEPKRGFKLSLDQLDAYPMLLKILVNNGCKIIYLTRQDRLAQILSLIKARESGDYHSTIKDSQDESYTFDKVTVKKQYHQIAFWEKTLLQNLQDGSYLQLSYEQLFHNYKECIDLIRAFLNLQKSTVYQYSDIVKGNRKSLDQWVSNLDEIKRYLEA